MRRFGPGDKMPPALPAGIGGNTRTGLSGAISNGNQDRGPRLAAIDIARGAAIVAMVVYHTAYDLSAHRLIATDVAGNLGWTIFARAIAGTFLFLVGISLVLATAHGIVWTAYLRRLGLIAGGALLVTLSTWWFDPQTFVFFGILHQIAAASVLALPFLRLPSGVVAIAAAVVLALPLVFTSTIFDWWPLWWIGLQTVPPVSVDCVPMFPWFGVVLAGIVGGRFIAANSDRIAYWRPTGVWARWLSLAGRWSLVIYLVHQPLIVGVISLAASVLPPNESVARSNFMSQCFAACERDSATCQVFCTCMFDQLWGTDLFAINSFDQMLPVQRQTFDGILSLCAPAEPAPQ